MANKPVDQSARLLTRIEESLELEQIEADIFRSKKLWKPTGARGVFGGQIIAQALAAATRTVQRQYRVHSLHSYFLLAGNANLPILYRVYKTRDGKSFITRSVSARQNGRMIFTMSVSFQLPEESVLEHQYEMPKVPPPEEVLTDKENVKKWLDIPNLPEKLVNFLKLRIDEPLPIEFKPLQRTELKDLFVPEKSTKQYVWLRAQGTLPDDLAFHNVVAAYASDHYLLGSANAAHGVTWFTKPIRITMMASLDHIIWFHRPFRADEWLLFEMESTRSGSGRGLTFGRMYTRDGTLVLSCAQEGVMRAGDAPLKSLIDKSQQRENEQRKEANKSKL